MDIAAMLLWMVTVGAGVSLLIAGRPARDAASRAAGRAAPATAPAPEPATAPAPARAVPGTAGVPQAAAAAYAAGAAVPPITHTRIATRPGEHPLLEFMHPALGLIGLGCSIAFVLTHFGTFAWAALAVIVVTITAGLFWYTVNARAARAAGTAPPAEARQPAESGRAPGAAVSGPPARHYPPQRLLAHGSAAAVTFALTLVTALLAHRA